VRVGAAQNEVAAQQRPNHGAQSVKRLGEVQALVAGFLRPERGHEGVGDGFECGQPAGQDEQRPPEKSERAGIGRGHEQESAQRVQPQAQLHAALVAEALHEQARRNAHHGIRPENGELH
jgi:hypothetical protein